jgi:signal peptidase I
MGAALDSTDAAKCALAVASLRAFGVLRLRVTGSSMLPSILPGDVLWFRRCAANEARTGEVVLFTREGRLFAHRLIARSAGRLVTQGDGVTAPDPPLEPEQLVGRACRILRRGRMLRPATRLSLTGRVVAAVVRRSVGAGRLLTRLSGPQERARP